MRQTIIKKRVELSTYCWIISALSSTFICGIFLYALQRPDNNLTVWISGAAIIMLFLSTLCYMPLSISLDNDSLNINRPLKIKSIPLSDIAEAVLCPPTMGAIRIQNDSIARLDSRNPSEYIMLRKTPIEIKIKN